MNVGNEANRQFQLAIGNWKLEMIKTTGFMEYARALPVLRPAAARASDWNEFHSHLPEPLLREQAARCMDCGVPFCHMGTTINGAASGIPNMKLEKMIVQRRVNLMSAEGVRFVTGINVGHEYGVDQLASEFDSIVLCGGATKPRDLSIEGRNLKGIHFAMEFLHANTRSLLDSNHQDGNYISANGKDVIVIGGGDTGTDCVATALRHGCRSLVQFEILQQPPQERPPDNPWPQWPKVHRIDYGHEEAAALFGKDPRAYSVMSKRFVGDDDGQVCAVRTIEVESTAGNNGYAAPREIPGTEKEWPAELVLLALGFLGPETSGLLSQLGVAIDARGNVAVDEEKATNVPAVFAAGDMARGQSLVVWAIADGRRAAKGVDRFLMGETMLP